MGQALQALEIDIVVKKLLDFYGRVEANLSGYRVVDLRKIPGKPNRLAAKLSGDGGVIEFYVRESATKLELVLNSGKVITHDKELIMGGSQ